ncbi:DUF2252 domain-containing protein [Schlesneria paludicola]|uniref:DUF2252 domain-containing protein n=1 Tax=Schlesneria paludicola TaxID=360056 RepID=UPI000299F976|nr:DUF2252 domain-containing protein [Schlesneria paludicola]
MSTGNRPSPQPGLTRIDRRAAGKAVRESIPRSAHAAWKPSADRPDIVSLLEESNRDRIEELVPLRYGRMLQSPLAFLRGSAIVMARDLSDLANTGIRLQICGDCHLQNFGWFASPERNLLFDVNDFDETRNAPWEWDLKRLAASVILAARTLKASAANQRQLVQAVVQEYRDRLAEYEPLSPLQAWYARLDAQALLNRAAAVDSVKRAQAMIDAARQRTIDSLLPKLTERVEGALRFKDRSSLLTHAKEGQGYLDKIQKLMIGYRSTLSDERQLLLDRYRLVDAAHKVVGIGSVGLRCGILLLLDPDDDPLVLQIKEARASVLEKYVGPSARTHHGHRIVHGQRVMQSASDIFLGWANDAKGRSYYFRQLRDMKLSLNVDRMSWPELQDYCQLCGWALARAHAKAGDASAIVGYVGNGDPFQDAISEFAAAYADQTELDFETLQNAAKSGRIQAVATPDPSIVVSD